MRDVLTLGGGDAAVVSAAYLGYVLVCAQVVFGIRLCVLLRLGRRGGGERAGELLRLLQVIAAERHFDC